MIAETQIARAMKPTDGRPSVLMTDGYKFSMAQSGFPLRQETFYLTFRQEGAYYVPFDLEEIVRKLLPLPVTKAEAAYLADVGYELTPAMRAAFDSKDLLRIKAVPPGSWVYGKEPLLTVTGPSLLVSWLEPLVIMLQFPIQVATEAVKGRRSFTATCQGEEDIIRAATEAAGQYHKVRVVRTDMDYFDGCVRRAKALLDAAQGCSVFEVGMRAATCMEQHRLVLRACQAVGIKATSNVYDAYALGLTPVGTTGHEHQQRWGCDIDAFRAVRDMRPKPPSYLFDTYAAERLGIPAVIQAVKETPTRPCFVRFDQRDKIPGQLRTLWEAIGSYPVGFIFEDGIRPDTVTEILALTDALGIDRNRLHFGSGGYLVIDPNAPFSRNTVNAVYKLTESSGNPVMKFSSSDKQSVPGKPVIFRRLHGDKAPSAFAEVVGIIGQEGEAPLPGFRLLDPNDLEQLTPEQAEGMKVVNSFETSKLVNYCNSRSL